MVATRKQKKPDKRSPPAAAAEAAPRAKRPRKCKDPPPEQPVETRAAVSAKPVANKPHPRKSSKKQAPKQAPAPKPPPPKNKSAEQKLVEAEKKISELQTTLSDVLRKSEPFVTKQFQSVKGYGPLLNDRWDTFSAWREQEEVSLAALNCGLDADNLVDTQLFESVDFLVKAIAMTKNKKQGQKLWSLIKNKNGLLAQKESKNRLYMAAFGRGLIDKFSQLPPPMQKNKKLLLKAIEDGLCPWKKLPVNYRRDVDFALAARSSISFSVVARSVTDLVALFKKWGVMSPRDLVESDWNLAPSEIIDDPTLMMTAISKNLIVAKHIGQELALDIEFVQKVLDKDILALAFFPEATYEAFPTIVSVESVQKFVKENTERGRFYNSNLKAVVPPGHWSDRKFVLAWVGTGLQAPERVEQDLGSEIWGDRAFVMEWVAAGCNPVASTSEALRDDPEIFMTLAKSKKQWKSFETMSERLRGDKDFIRRLLQYARPMDIMSIIPSELKESEELKIACLAGRFSDNLYHIFQGSYSERIDSRNRLREKIRGWVAAHNAFVKGVLCGSQVGSGSSLEVFAQHLGIKRNIGSYLFPQGPTLVNVFRAAANLGVLPSRALPDNDDSDSDAIGVDDFDHLLLANAFPDV